MKEDIEGGPQVLFVADRLLRLSRITFLSCRWDLAYSSRTRRGGRTPPYSAGVDHKRIIALSPRIDLASTRTMEEYTSIVLGLLQERW